MSDKIQNATGTAPMTPQQVSGTTSALEPREQVKLEIFVKETRRKLCTVCLPETSTINDVKEQVIKKNLKVLVKNLFINEKDCRPRMITVYT